MRGKKLMAWDVPPTMLNALNNSLVEVEGSTVIQAQRQMLVATKQTLAAIGIDVQNGLLETVGINSRWELSERCSVIIELPPNADPMLIAQAIDLENVEAWCDDLRQVHVAIGPWYSTKDVDQVVLCIIKVVHVLLGLHATSPVPAQPTTVKQRFLHAVRDILLLQKQLPKK